MSDFTFVPRSVAKRKVHPPQPSVTQEKKTRQELSSLPSSSSNESNTKSNFTTDDILTLLCLCLSRYNIWLDPELLRIIQKSEEGYAPVQYLLENVSPLCELENRPSELEIVNALRSTDNGIENIFEIRMVIQGPSRNEWLSPTLGNHAHVTSGLFEIRRRDYEKVIRSINEDSDIGKHYWDSRTIYVERLPMTYRTKHAVAQYIYRLVTNATRGLGECSKRDFSVQGVSFPPHHSDSERTGPPRCKAFAFVILDSCSSAETLVNAYPWSSIGHAQLRGRQTNEDKDIEGTPSNVDAEAAKFGTRVLSKTSWDKLKEEYLNYQKTILALDAKAEQKHEFGLADTSKSDIIPKAEASLRVLGNPRAMSLPRAEAVVTPNETYPKNCLIFVKNIHPETNKTTLRQFFTPALSSAAAIDYVDFTKGIDSCHLRLINPSEASRLASHFGADAKSSIAQLGALDNQGGSPSADRPPVITELVQGKREELYWERVPQKLREKALAVAWSGGQCDTPRDNNDEETTNKTKRRKGYR